MVDQHFLQELAQQLRKPNGERGIQVSKNMNRSNALMNTLTIDALDIRAHDFILEIGMGNGFFVSTILADRPGVHYFGCDYSDLMIAEAAALNQSFVASGQAQFILASADQLPFPSHYFDKIFTINTIYFWQNPSVELAEIKRVLKNNGHLFITIRSDFSMEQIPVTQFGFTLYDKEKLTALVEANGFKVHRVIEQEEAQMEFSGKKVKPVTWVFEIMVSDKL